ncbi:MAG: MurT ligase domain-containing protein, partial [Oscillospiraceae bacterium]|nr:MurT ligase domain-containing protein [Oscillospiraceae bacterium]
MRKFIAILVCKFLRAIGKTLKKGSSLPGGVALRIDPNILKKIKMPGRVLAVTGSNGKSSTVAMIAHILSKNSEKFAFNKGGSNQIQGVTTSILEDCSLLGKARSNIFLFEMDELFAKHILKFLKPTHFLVTNLFRDQQSRNGNPEWIYKNIERSIENAKEVDVTMVLNANDPLVSYLGFDKKNTIWFGFDKISGATQHIEASCNDGKFCPKCKYLLTYECYHYSHLGKFSCQKCGFKAIETPQYVGSCPDGDKRHFFVNDKYEVKTLFKNISVSFYYNLLAAFAGANLLGVSPENICKSLSTFTIKNLRTVNFNLDEYEGILLISKHENPVSYDQSIKVITDHKKPCTVVVIIDSISRRYMTTNISWIYDVNFEMLKSENIKKVILSGFYCNDLAVCLSLAKVSIKKISVFEKIPDCVNYLRANTEGKIFTVT